MELTILCKELNNWFDSERYFDTFVIENGSLKNAEDLKLQNGQYFRIVGSIFNDGVYQHPADKLKDETFDGAVWAMAIPQAVVDLCSKITDWEKEYASVISSPFSSESFGGYSYTKGVSNSGLDGSKNALNSIFGAELNRWRKV